MRVHLPRAPRARALARVLALAACALALLLLPREASAHGKLARSVPARGARLDAAPRELRLTFTEAIELTAARIALAGPDGAPVALSPLAHAGDSTRVLVTAITGSLAAGEHSVTWRIVGRDGHPVSGSFTFVIAPGASGLAPPAAPPRADSAVSRVDSVPAAAVAARHPAPTPRGDAFDAESPLYAAARWATYAALLALVGAVCFAWLVVPGAARAGALPEAQLAAGARRVMLGAAGLLVGAALARLVAQSAAMHGADGALDPSLLGATIGSTVWGRGWLVHAAGAVAAVAGAATWRTVRRPALAALGAIAAALGMALSGHAAAAESLAPVLVAADALHILGAGGWLGTLLVLALAGIPAALRAAPAERAPAAALLVRAFSPIALACAALLVVTGAIAAWVHLGGLAALWESRYGALLLAKLALLALVAGIGAYNWRVATPRLSGEAGARRLRASATAELVVGALVLAVTAILVATPPPAGPGAG
jgi:putative copper export protein/methionine-rich copper-binding protein CopC